MFAGWRHEGHLSLIHILRVNEEKADDESTLIEIKNGLLLQVGKRRICRIRVD